MSGTNADFPSDRERFRQEYGYDFPYDSDEDPASIDEHYGNRGASLTSSRTPSIQGENPIAGSFKSSGTGSIMLGITQEPLRIPLSSENLAAYGMTNAQRRMSELTNSYQSAEPLSECDDGEDGDIMDAFLKTIDASYTSADDEDIQVSTMRRESIRSKPWTSDKSVAEKSMAESTFFFGNLSTSDEGTTNRLSRERINIPTVSKNDFLQKEIIPTFPIEDREMDIDLKMMSDDKSVRSALTCDRSYAMEEALRKLQHDALDEEDETTVNSLSQVDGSERNDAAQLKSRASSPGSARKSTCSSHHGSFMAWPDSDDEGESSEEEEKSEDTANKTAEKGNLDDGAIVCDFVPDRAAFKASRAASFSSSRGSIRSAASSKGNSQATSNSRKSEPSSSSNSSKERRQSRRQKRRASMRGSLETIKSEQSHSFRGSLRRSLSESIDRKNVRESFRRSSLTQQHDATSSALPLMGWDDSNSESSSLLSSSERKLSASARKSFSSSLSNSEQGGQQGGLFTDKWVTRSSFKRGHDLPGLTNAETSVPIEEEFDSRKPWMKAPPVAPAMPSDRRGSTMTLDSSINSLNESIQLGLNSSLPQAVKDDKADGLASSKGVRSSFTDLTATSSLGDDQSINSDLTELRQAQEALLNVQEENDAEFDKQQHVDEAMKLLATFPTIPKAARDTPSPTLQLESVDEEDEYANLSSPVAHADRLETVEEEQDDENAALLDQAARANHVTDKRSFTNDASSGQFLDDLDADVSQRFSRSPKEDDSDTYSDVEVGVEKSAPSLGLYMSVHNHELEKEFNTTEMEEIDFKECHKPDEYNESEDLEQFLESGRKNRSTKEDHSSHKSGKSSSKRSGLASMKVISDKLKPIKDRVKKKSGSNHVRRRHKRLWKFCVWNCKKITLLIVLVLCVLAGIAVSSWYGSSKKNAEPLEEVTTDDQMTGDLSIDIQWPPVADTGRNPLHDNSPTIAPSTEVTSQAQISNTTDGTHLSANSSSANLFNQSLLPSAQPSSVSLGQNTSTHPSILSNTTWPAPSILPPNNSTSPSIALNFSSLSPTYAVTPSISLDLNQTDSPTQSPTFNISLNQTYPPTQSPTLSPTLSITTQSPSLSPTNNSAIPTISPTEDYLSIFQSSQIIAGDDEFQYTGFSVSMTPSGNFIAVGAKEAYETGMVRIYVKKRGSFTPLGADSIFGESPGDEMGSAVAISDDGKIVAVGARSSSSSSFGKSKSGLVKVYQYSESLDSWLQMGNTIEGSEELERLGFSVAISGDGLRVACGSPKGSGGLGHVGIYDFNNRKGWGLVGDVITGQKKKDMAGFSLSMSSDGSVVAVGAISASLNGMERCGSVTMYNLDASAQKWVTSGQMLTGIVANAQFGYSIKLSGDGQRVVIGSNGVGTTGLSNVGSCEIFQLNSKTFRWKQIGAVFGDDQNEEAGSHVSMSANGLWVACSKTTMASGSPEGAVAVLNEQGGDWNVVETITPFFEDSTSFGSSTHFSQDGEDIIIGAPLFNSTSGYVELLSREKQG